MHLRNQTRQVLEIKQVENQNETLKTKNIFLFNQRKISKSRKIRQESK